MLNELPNHSNDSERNDSERNDSERNDNERNDDERITALKKYIRHHIHEPIDRARLAAVVGLSVPHLHRVFATQVGENIASYVRRMRLERAGQKLRMGAVDIGEIALAAGYETHSAFGKAFKQHFGLSPSEFRQLDCWAATKLIKKGKS